MYSSLHQIADRFTQINDEDWSVEEVVMHTLDFPAFYEQNAENIELTGAPWLSGEVVGYMWGATIRLSNGLERRIVRLSAPDGNLITEGELLL